MARAEQVKLYRSFVKGLITEASYLTYPEDSSVDELNTTPSRKGNRTRRFGIDYEDNFIFNELAFDTTKKVNEFVWKAVNNDGGTNFLCLQVGAIVRFFSLEESPISDSLKAFSIDLTTYVASGVSLANVSLADCEFASGKGYLFIVNPYIDPISVEYDKITNTVSVTKISIQVRDFEGLNDNLANDEEPAALTKEHKYNLMNQGWVTPGRYVVPGGVTIDNIPVYHNPYQGSEFPYGGGFNIP